MLDMNRALNNDRVIKAMTGLSCIEFFNLLPIFEKALIANKKVTAQRASGGGRKGALKDSKSKLFFILFYFKAYPTMDVCGVLFGVDRSKICHWVKKFTKILELALGYAAVLPQRRINSVAEFMEKFANDEIIIDGVERKVQRPQKAKLLRKQYSGKKKSHTRKNIVISDKNRKILLISPSKDGKFHDKTMLDKEQISQSLPHSIDVLVDKGFTGMQKQSHARIHVPKKKSKKKPLDDIDKENNRIIASFRMPVEHAIGGMKRFGIVSDIFRNKHGFDDQATFVCSGLWNFHIIHRI